MIGEKSTVLCNSDVSLPVMTHLELEISNPCNERCIHCYHTCGCTACGFLSQQDVEHILEEASLLMNTELYKVDTDFYAYIRLKKDFIARRDKIFKMMQGSGDG